MSRYLHTKDDFNAALAEAGEKLVVVDYTASWNGSCQSIDPKFEELANIYTDCKFYKVDVDENAETAEDQGISSMPTFIYYRSGKRVDSLVGDNVGRLEDKIKLWN